MENTLWLDKKKSQSLILQRLCIISGNPSRALRELFSCVYNRRNNCEIFMSWSSDWGTYSFGIRDHDVFLSGKHHHPDARVNQPATTKVYLCGCLLTFVHCYGAAVRVIRLRRHLRQGPVVTHRVKHSGENGVLHLPPDGPFRLARSVMHAQGARGGVRVVFALNRGEIFCIFSDNCLEMKGGWSRITALGLRRVGTSRLGPEAHLSERNLNDKGRVQTSPVGGWWVGRPNIDESKLKLLCLILQHIRGWSSNIVRGILRSRCSFVDASECLSSDSSSKIELQYQIRSPFQGMKLL